MVRDHPWIIAAAVFAFGVIAPDQNDNGRR